MNKRIKKIAIMLVVAVCLIAVTFAIRLLTKKKPLPCVSTDGSVTLSGEYFGTVMSITLHGERNREVMSLIEECYAEVARLEKIFSAKLPDSELTRINELAFHKEIAVSDEMYEVLKAGLEYYNRTEGALDISIGNMINLWGIGTDNEGIPAKDELDELTGIKGCRYIVLDEEKRVHFEDPRVRIDLGAIAKGYAADRVKALVNERMPEAYGILNFGGNIVTIGSKAGDNWTVGITNPFDVGQVYATIKVKDKCVVTSGNYERYFERDGVRYHHILDANTGYPAQSGIVSATIIGENSMLCDALSTATYVLGTEKALSLIEGIDGVEAVFIKADGKAVLTSGVGRLMYTLR